MLTRISEDGWRMLTPAFPKEGSREGASVEVKRAPSAGEVREARRKVISKEKPKQSKAFCESTRYAV